MCKSNPVFLDVSLVAGKNTCMVSNSHCFVGKLYLHRGIHPEYEMATARRVCKDLKLVLRLAMTETESPRHDGIEAPRYDENRCKDRDSVT
ncbi:MAG: hypothetical protein ABIR03_00830 [Ginsengibacter sp.]